MAFWKRSRDSGNHCRDSICILVTPRLRLSAVAPESSINAKYVLVLRCFQVTRAARFTATRNRLAGRLASIGQKVIGEIDFRAENLIKFAVGICIRESRFLIQRINSLFEVGGLRCLLAYKCRGFFSLGASCRQELGQETVIYLLNSLLAGKCSQRGVRTRLPAPPPSRKDLIINNL
jgi:hypothetical protein